MKLLLVTAAAIAVFTVNCRDFSSESEGRGAGSKVQLFPEDIEDQGKMQNFPDGADGNRLAENQNSDYNDQQMQEVKREQHQSPLRTVCSEASGFFNVPNSGNHCYKFFTDSRRSWQASKAKCQDEGLLLAKPVDPVALRKYLLETFGDKRAWIGGRGTGLSYGSGSVQWIRDSSILRIDDEAWYPCRPGSWTSTSDCLLIRATPYDMYHYPTKPYYMGPCTWHYYALCEVAE